MAVLAQYCVHCPTCSLVAGDCIVMPRQQARRGVRNFRSRSINGENPKVTCWRNTTPKLAVSYLSFADICLQKSSIPYTIKYTFVSSAFQIQKKVFKNLVYCSQIYIVYNIIYSNLLYVNSILYW